MNWLSGCIKSGVCKGIAEGKANCRKIESECCCTLEWGCYFFHSPAFCSLMILYSASIPANSGMISGMAMFCGQMEAHPPQPIQRPGSMEGSASEGL